MYTTIEIQFGGCCAAVCGCVRLTMHSRAARKGSTKTNDPDAHIAIHTRTYLGLLKAKRRNANRSRPKANQMEKVLFVSDVRLMFWSCVFSLV